MKFVEELKWRGMIHDIMPGTEELLEKEQGSEGERSLQADIRRWRDRVKAMLMNGASDAQIASTLKISEFLVQCIKNNEQEAA